MAGVKISPVHRGPALAGLLGVVLMAQVLAVLAHPGHSEAIAYFSAQIAKQPQQPQWYLERGLRYLEDGLYPEAKQDFTQVEKLAGEASLALPMGILYYRTGEYTQARQQLDAVLARDFNNFEALQYRSQVAHKLGDLPTAIGDLKRYMKIRSGADPALALQLSELYLERGGNESFQRALTALDRANLELGITPQIQQRAVSLENRRGRPDLALQRLETLESITSASPEWCLAMARQWHLLNRDEKASYYANEAIDRVTQMRLTPARQQTRIAANSFLQMLASQSQTN